LTAVRRAGAIGSGGHHPSPWTNTPQADALIEGLPADIVLADTAYDSDRLRNAIADKGAVAVIPNNPSRAQKYPLDKHLYAQRHLTERCISRLKQFRRVATRFEKPPKTTSQSSLSRQSSYGSDNCPHYLVRHELSGPTWDVLGVAVRGALANRERHRSITLDSSIVEHVLSHGIVPIERQHPRFDLCDLMFLNVCGGAND